ncbi:MAG: hypothetical protein IKR61_03390 [Lachnospiraceae bacterium]|nr:hypothetical protein [Lachnospiraceae bacterium]
MMRKKLLQISISALLALSLLAGCGSAPAEEEEVELIEPVGVTADYAVVTRRDLQTVKILNGKVVPKVSEVTFSGGQNFKKYGNMPGMNVRAGDVIVYGSTESIDNQIKDLQEQIDAASEDMTDYLSETNKQLAEYIQHEKNCADVMDSFDGMTEEERENYENYDSEYEKYRRIYQQATAQREKCEQELKKKTELYALDSEYNQKKLRRLQKKREEVLALAPVDGNLVAINYFDENSWVAKETPVGAVGDLNALELKTDQVFESEVKRAEDVFAIVNGKRYEVEFKKSESAAASEGETASADGYATFLVDDPAHEVKAGDFGIVVLIARQEKDVLSVPKDAINTDSDGTFVYRYEGDTTVFTPVKTGLSAGMFTEIVSGLEEGDRVVSEYRVTAGDRTTTLKKGRIYTTFKQNGYLFYSQTEWVKNPVEYGTAYLDEIKVQQYERVEKGQTVAIIRVKPNALEIARSERTLLRAQEDLAELVRTNVNDSNAKQIGRQNRTIADLQKKISEMKTDAATTEVKAPYSGIITGMIQFEEGDILQKDGRVVQISSEDNCYVVCEDENGQLTVGNEVLISYSDNNVGTIGVRGDVVTVAPCALSKSLATGYTLMKVSPEDMTTLSGINQGAGGWWMRAYFTITSEVRSMDNVLLVPKTAVKLEGGVTYVKVKDADGRAEYVSFIAGGSDNNNYWVVSGLSEGMTICLE